MTGLLPGLDIGTTATKCVLVDPGRRGVPEHQGDCRRCGNDDVLGAVGPAWTTPG
jgi:hypothetical protein